MTDSGGQDMVAFLGAAPDRRLLDEDLDSLPAAEQRHEPEPVSHGHNRLVAAGSFMTGASLIGGALLTLYALWRLVFHSGGAVDIALIVVGVLLVATHWGWVHVAEYVGITLDEHETRALTRRAGEWLGSIEPYPRFSVTTSVLADASTRVERVLHRPVLTSGGKTFTFERETVSERVFGAEASAEEIADGVETLRRQARLDTDRQRELWEAASSTYHARLLHEQDEEERLAAQRAAAAALSEHINESLREPPLVE
jgi:hypothetical protein